jgi:AcrR family transcriptional regulator
MARPRQVSDEAILAVARSCFLTHGPQASTQRIADELGVSQAALFKRFRTKNDLMIAALTPPPPPWLAMLDRGPDARPIEVQLFELASAMSAYFDQTFPCFAILKASGICMPEQMGDEEPMPLRTHRALTAWLRTAAERGDIRAVDASAIATLIMGALHGHAFLSHFLRAELGPAEDHVREIVGVVWSGIRPVESR